MIDDVIKKLTMLKDYGINDHYGIRELCNDFQSSFQDVMYSVNLKPKTNHNYVGVEIEFYSRSDYMEIFDEFLQLGLQKKVVLGYDGSLHEDYEEFGYEVKILDIEDNILNTISQVCSIINRHGPRIDSRCGLHVHLDMRNRNKVKCKENLYMVQDLLYKMVHPDRENNSYCRRVRNIDYINSHEHDFGLELTDFKTLEVRLHHGTTNKNEIMNWVKVLMRIVNKRRKYTRNIDNGITLKQIIERSKFTDNELKYINDTIKKHDTIRENYEGDHYAF